MSKQKIRALTVKGTDTETGQPSEIIVRVESLADAHEFGARRGISVKEIHTESGVVFAPQDDGGYRRINKGDTSARGGSDAALLIISLLIPLIGLIAGAVQLAKRDSSGMKVIAHAVIGNLIWLFLLVFLMNR